MPSISSAIASRIASHSSFERPWAIVKTEYGQSGVGRALVAVADAAERGHARAELGDAVLGHLPDAHAVGAEAGAAVEEDRGDAAQQAALLHPLHVLEQLRHWSMPSSRGGGRVRLGDDRQVALGRADRRRRRRSSYGTCGVESARRDDLGGGRERLGVRPPSRGPCGS